MQPKKPKSEKEFLQGYNPKDFDRPSTSVDNVVYTILDGALHVLIVKRSHHPFQNCWSLVGGFVDLDRDHDLEATAKRKLEEKTGVKTPYLEQFYTVGNKDRDPRCWSVTTVYFALIPCEHIELRAGSGAKDIRWSRVQDGKISENMAFDHAKILEECTKRLKNKVLYTSLPVHLMQGAFTLNELQEVYEIILAKSMDHKSFRRRILAADILEETGDMKQTGRRPAMLYQPKQCNQTYFFVRNIEGAQGN